MEHKIINNELMTYCSF